MLTRDATHPRLSLVEADGVTLVELLVVILAGLVVLAALLTILEVTMRQTARTFSQVDATRQARIALDKLQNELESACVADGITPIQTGSNGNDLWFVSQYGSSASNANAASPIPVEHKISYSPSNGIITDSIYAVSGGTAPNWTFSTTASRTARVVINVSARASIPVFQYFAYQNPGSQYHDADGGQYQMIIDGLNYIPGTTIQPAASPLTMPLVPADAQAAAEVLINVVVGPAGGTNINPSLSPTASITNQAVLRLTPPVNDIGGGATFAPCA